LKTPKCSKMAGAHGKVNSVAWTEHRNPARGATRGLEIGENFYVGVPGDLPHDRRCYEGIVRQMLLGAQAGHDTIKVNVTLGGKQAVVTYTKVTDSPAMYDLMRNGYATTNGREHEEIEGVFWYRKIENGEEGPWMYSFNPKETQDNLLEYDQPEELH